MNHGGGHDLAKRALQRIAAVFRYAIQTGRASYNPGQDMKGALKGRIKQPRLAIKGNELPEFIERLNGDTCLKMTKLGIMLIILTWLRSAELRAACGARLTLITGNEDKEP